MVEKGGIVHRKRYHRLKKVFLVCVLILSLWLGYTVVDTKLTIVGMGGYKSLVSVHQLEEDEILHGIETFQKSGVAPIRIESIEIINPNKTKYMDVAVFYGLRQNLQMSGGQLDYEEYLEFYGNNLYPIYSLKWLKDKKFSVVITSRETAIRNVWIKVRYRIYGIFTKEVISEEIRV